MTWPGLIYAEDIWEQKFKEYWTMVTIKIWSPIQNITY